MGRRRAGAGSDTMADDHDFFERLPYEFRQYIPESFGHRRAGSGPMPQQQTAPPPTMPTQYYQNYAPAAPATPPNGGIPQSPSKKLCDAAIQTEDPAGVSQVDGCASAAAPMHTENLNQHGLRNTVDMGVKSALENEAHGPRSHSAPPPEQQQEQLLHQQQQAAGNGQQRPTPPPQGRRAPFPPTQSSQSPQAQPQSPSPSPLQFQKSYYAPQHQSHPQQKQKSPPAPQTPGGTYVRTIPIFVEGRSEPIINAHKEIPNQNAGLGQGNNTSHSSSSSGGNGNNASATASASAGTSSAANGRGQGTQPQGQQTYYQQAQQQQPAHSQHRPAPLNTQQQAPPQQAGGSGPPAQTPHTLDSINKIQDIQRDVLDLMGQVENFKGTRKDKDYAYLDEMLTRNLLKLDTIDTNGKDSIRLARKEAIKCIQASINVLEAKAEENAKTAANVNANADAANETALQTLEQCSIQTQDHPTATISAEDGKLQEAIPLPPPVGMQLDEQQYHEHALVANKANNSKEPSPETNHTKANDTSSASIAAAGSEQK